MNNKPKRVFELLDRLKASFQKEDILSSKENGKWVKYSTNSFISNVNSLSRGLLNKGLGKNDKIGIISNNRPEWHFADYASQQIAAVSVPIYPTISETDLAFILKDSGMKLIFVSSEDLYLKVKNVAAQALPGLMIYTFNSVSNAPNWKELLIDSSSELDTKIAALKNSVNENDLLTILYTSGTTGTPKGVMLSHKNLLSNSYASESLAPFQPTWRALSFLPLNHVYERMLNTLYLYLGISIYFAESLETIGDNLKEVKPQIFATVPRLLEKVYDKIVAKGEELTGIKRKLFFWSLNLGLQYEFNGKGPWYKIQLAIANALVFKKWREALGNEIEVICSGGAALQPRLARVFNSAKIIVLEGYGLTETSPVIAVNNLQPDSIRFGTVGPVIDEVTVKIAEDGEILVKGPNVMLGYYNRPDLTSEVIDKEGWFHTGDIGEFVEKRFLKITDRKKEIFKTSGGKYIAPLVIENKLKESPFIEQAMVIGEGEKFPSALIIPSFQYIKEWGSKNGLSFSSNVEIAKNEKVISTILAEIEKTNEHLAQYEKIKNPQVLEKEWSIESNEMTPKLSLKRKEILKNNSQIISKIYAS